MTIANKLETINTSLQDIKSAIIAKGVTPTGNITTYATAITGIDSVSGEDSTVETRTLTIKAINTVDSEGGYWCKENNSPIPQNCYINNTLITQNDWTDNGFTYGMYVPNAVYEYKNLSCYTYQVSIPKDTQVNISIVNENTLNLSETDDGVTQENGTAFHKTITLTKDTTIKLFWGFNSDDIDFDDGGGDLIIN